VGEEHLDTLVNLKSKNELIGDIISLLQSPAKNVLSALLSGKNTVAGLVKALEERKQ
jgi:large subunit ribosomal protein L10